MVVFARIAQSLTCDIILKSKLSIKSEIKSTSVIQMLKKLRKQDLIVYNKNGIKLTESGQKMEPQ